MRESGENRRSADLVTVEVKDREYDPIGKRVEKFIRLPGGRQRACFRFSVPDNAGNDQIGIIEYCSARMTQ